MGDISATIASLGSASSGSADLDRAIGLSVVRLPYMKGPIHVFARIDALKIPGFELAPFPPYTSRLDTAAGLVGILLPSWEWRLNFTPSSGVAILRRPNPAKTDELLKTVWSEKDSSAYVSIALVKVALEAASQIGSP
jgi:hypothetical protein